MVAEQETGAVRIRVDDNGDEWFVAKDVCRALGISNTATAQRSLEDNERGVIGEHTSSSGVQKMAVVSEAGLYMMLARGRKSQSNAFVRWVAHDVLPRIRSAGPCNGTVFEQDSVRIDDLMRDISSNLAALTAEKEAPASFDDTRKLLAMADESGCNPLDIALALAMKTAAECGQWEIAKLLTESLRDTRVEF